MPGVALVTGATGVIGPVLVTRLLEKGYRVRILSRKPPDSPLWNGIDVFRGDVTDSRAVGAALQGSDVVFHLAAKLHINSPSPRLASDYQRVNVEGTRIVAEAAQNVGVRRLVFFSTIAVYGSSRPGEILTEESALLGNTLYSSTKRAAETLVLALGRSSGGEPLSAVLRIAGVYGARIKGNYREMVRWLRRGLFVPVGNGLNRRTLVYDRDVAEAAIIAAEHPAAAGNIFNVTDGRIHTFNEIVTAISDALGRPPPKARIPLRYATVAGTLVDRSLSLAGKRPMARALIEKMTEDMAVSGAKIQELLGFRPGYDLRSGWADTIAQLREF